MSNNAENQVSSNAFVRRDPSRQSPVLFETPRSGRTYPGDFQSIACLSDLQKSVSMYVEDCYRDVVNEGATWLFAPCPNTYIDLNRHELDIDPEQLAGPWDGELQPSALSQRGSGLIPMMCARTVPMYDRKLEVEEVKARVKEYYWPYHDEVSRLLSGFRKTFGHAVHLSCHSMPDIVAFGPDIGSRRSEFDLGDRHGTTCSPALTDAVATFLRERGYNVTINTYFVGAEAVRKHGNPKEGVHSLQIEMNRGLFMDEARRVPIERMNAIRADMQALARKVAELSDELAA